MRPTRAREERNCLFALEVLAGEEKSEVETRPLGLVVTVGACAAVEALIFLAPFGAGPWPAKVLCFPVVVTPLEVA